MIYPFMTLEDDTEIVHSEMKDNGEVKVYIETPDEKVLKMPQVFKVGSNIPKNVLKNIMRIIEARSVEVINKWIDFYDEIEFYC